jgi:hypothetical protein
MLRHLSAIAALAVLAHMAIDGPSEGGDDLKKRRAARSGKPNSIGGGNWAVGCLPDLRQQPEVMCQTFVPRCAFEAVLGRIGAGSGNLPDLGTTSDQVDDLIPFFRSRQRTEPNVTHRLLLELRRSVSLNHSTTCPAVLNFATDGRITAGARMAPQEPEPILRNRCLPACRTAGTKPQRQVGSSYQHALIDEYKMAKHFD